MEHMDGEHKTSIWRYFNTNIDSYNFILEQGDFAEEGPMGHSPIPM